MNSDSPKTPREEMETWLTSLLLGELSEGEAAAVRELIKHDPELAKLHEELKSTIQLVQQATVSAAAPTGTTAGQPKLSVERREKLMAQFKTVAPKEFLPEKRRVGIRLVELAAVLAILAILAAMLLPALSKAKSKAQSVSVLNNLRQLEIAKEQWAQENKSSAKATPTFDDLKPYLGRGEMPSVAGETYVLGAVGEPPSAELAAVDAKKTFRRWTGNLPASSSDDRVRLFADGKAYSFDSSGLSSPKEVSGKSIGGDTLSFRTWGSANTPADKSPLQSPGQSVVYYDSSAGAQDHSGFNPVAALVPSTPIILPAQSPADSLGQAGNYAFTPAAASPNVAYSSIQVSGQPVTEQNASLPTRSLRSGGRATDAANPPVPTVAPASGSAEPARLIDPTTGLPVAATTTGDATPKLETREFAVNREALHRALETVSPSEEAFRRRYSPDTGSPTIPRVSVVGQVQGGGGGGGGAGTTPTPTLSGVSETTPNNGNVPLSDTAGVKLKADDESKSVSLGDTVQTRGITMDGVDKFDTANRARTPAETTLQDSYYFPLAKAEAVSSVKVTNALRPDQNELLSRSDWYAAKTPTTDGAIVLGRTFTNSTDANDRLGYEVASSESVDRPTKDSQKYYRLLSQLGDDAGELSTNSLNLRYQSVSVANGKEREAGGRETPLLSTEDYKRFPGERTNGESKLRELNSQLEALKDRDSVAAEELSKQIADTQERLRTSEDVEKKRNADNARLAATRPYYDAKRNLEDMVDFQRLLRRKLNLESIDERLPKSSQVEILERAEAQNEPSQTFWGGIRNAVSGDVERTARIKVDRDKSDIGELNTDAATRSSNPYDPHFIQTEFEIIKSETVLGRVAEVLGMTKNTDSSLKKSETLAQLRKRLDLHAVPNSTVVEIRAKSEKPEEAAKIANTVADVYQQWRLDKGNELVKSGLKSLEERSLQQEEKIRKAKVELAQLGQSLGISETDVSGVTKGIDTDLPIRQPSTNAPIPQPEIQTSENNFSTFSLNVSDVSFKLAAASLEKGQMPDVASVRSEEFINAFDYRDPEPSPGAPIAFAYERARYPFAHNRDLLRFSLKTAAAGRQAGRALNLVLLLDNSGSMERADRVRIIREALRVLAGQLQPQDKLSVITFARTPRLVADGISGDKTGDVTEAVSGLTPEGGTNLEEAMNLGYQTAARHYVIGGINRLVVLTDGAANLGDVEPDSLKQKIEDARKQGIALDCFGIGWEGFNDDLLEVLSRNGDGRYGFINSPEEAAREFAGQLAGALRVAASDVKVQVEFNPRRVTSYRQIGYAKHQLTKEQFRDNTVDAAEIAAQEAGNALYTVEVNPAGAGPFCTVRVRYKIPGTSDYREQAWDVPYTGSALSLEQSSPAMRLAGSAAAFSEWLVASPFAGDVSPDGVLNVLRGVPEVFGADSRPRTLEWMIRQAKRIEGK